MNLLILLLLSMSGCTFLQSSNLNFAPPKSGTTTVTLGSTTCSRQIGAVTGGGTATGMEYVTSLVVDSSGNTYIGGITDGSFGGPAAGGMDVFVAKFKPDCTLEFIKQFGSSSEDWIGTFGSGASNGQGMAVDSLGNIYVVGTTSGDLFEVNGAGSGSGSNDAFVVKMDSSGNIVWSKQFGSVTATTLGWDASFYDYGSTIKIDGNNNVWLNLISDGSMIEPFGGSGPDIVLVQLDSAGSILWGRQYGSVTKLPGQDTSGSEYPTGLALTSSGGAVVGISTWGSYAYAGAQPGTSIDMAYLRVDSTGLPIGTGQVGNAEVGLLSDRDDWETGVAVDASDNVYLVGLTEGNLGETNGALNPSGTYTTTDIVLSKFSSSDAYQWVKQWGAASVVSPWSSAAEDQALFIRVAPDQGVILGGGTQSNFADTQSMASSGMDGLLIKVDGSGNTVWTKQYGASYLSTGLNSGAAEVLLGAEFDGAGNLVTSGITTDLFEANGGSYDAFMMVVNPSNGEVLTR